MAIFIVENIENFAGDLGMAAFQENIQFACRSRLRFMSLTADMAPSLVRAPPAPDTAVKLIKIGLSPSLE